VSYSLGPEYVEDFSIDSVTGEIRTRRPFDRESQDIYQLEVIAKDGAPSAVLKPNPLGLPNERKMKYYFSFLLFNYLVTLSTFLS